VEEDTCRTLAERVRDHALNNVLEGRLGQLTLVHPTAPSFTVQRVEVVPVLPCQEWLTAHPVPRGVRSRNPLLMESPVEKVVEYLVWLWLGEKLYEAFGQSRLAEFAARSVHLEVSSQELQRRKKKLLLRYFRVRHEVIDQSMRELFAARSLYSDHQ
jgi:F0F1-type ATP synthase gamma subunit